VRSVSGTLVDAGEATISTTGSNLDFMIALAGVCSLQVLWEVPWRPHGAVKITIAWNFMKIRVPQLRLYKDVPLLEGPRLPWSSFERGNVRLRNELACPRHQFLDTDLSQLFGDWMAQAGGWLTSVETDLDTKSLGRGVHVAIEMQPLAMPDIPLERLWKNPSLDYWQALAAWVETFQRHTGFDKPATRDLKVRMRELIGKAAARIENLRVELEGLHFDEARKLKSLLYKVGFLKANDLANVVHDLGLLKHYFLKTLLKLKAEEWATTVQEMIKGSGKSAFAFRAEAVELRPFQNLAVTERPQARRNYWQAKWGEAW